MILVIDVGNTQTCLAIYEPNNNEAICHWRASTQKNVTVDELASRLLNLLSKSDFKLQTISSIVISCVVPSLAVVYEKCATSLIKSRGYDTKVVVCNAQNAKKLDPKIYDCKYIHPNEVGSDIIASCIAARTLHTTPCAIIDFGTATNINVLNKEGEFVGAVIAPGMKTSLDALISDAGALSEIELKIPNKVIGNSTSSLIQSGAIIGEACRADGLIDKIEEELGYPISVICTGGWSKLLHTEMKHETI